MVLLSMVFLAANTASRFADAGPGIMIVPAPCALFYAGSGGFVFDLYILAKKVDPFRDYLGLGLWDCHDEGARKRVLA